MKRPPTTVMIAIIALILGAIFPEQAATGLSQITSWFSYSFGWLVYAGSSFFVLLCFYLALSKHGKKRLGDDPPQFSTLSWFAMLFAAGMGAGLVFYGAAEPLIHTMKPPPGATESGFSEARYAMALTYFHWGLHAWAIYAMAALTIGWFAFQKDAPMLPSAPASRKRMIAGTLNAIATLAVVFGLVATLSQGMLQLSNGIKQLFTLNVAADSLQLPILLVLCICFMASAATGIGKGIKILSNINMLLALLLMCYVLIAGPAPYMLERMLVGLKDYIILLPDFSFASAPFETATAWQKDWSIAYLLWWVAWAPFVGVFIARISRGRSIRQFVLGVLFVPCAFSAIWFAVFGGAALHLETISQPGFGEMASAPQSVTYALLETLPYSKITSALALLLLFIFLVTSADSGAYVLGMFTQHGAQKPCVKRRLFWGMVVGIATAGSVMVGGSTQFYRSVAIFGGVPYLFIMLWQCFGLLRALRHSPKA